MKRLAFLGVLVLLAASCAAGGTSPEEVAAPQGPARLTRLKGKVSVKRSNGDDFVEAGEGMDLFENDKVRTAPGAGALIELSSGGRVAVSEDALVLVAETRIRPGQERSDLTVLQGRVDAELPDVQHQAISVTTPNVTVRAGRKIEFQ